MMTFPEIAKELGIKEQTAYAHYRKALRKLAGRGHSIHEMQGLAKLLQSERQGRVKEGLHELRAFHR